MDGLWTAFLALDQEFQYGHSDKISAKDIPFDLARFISHCCKLRHYFFDILKYGKSDCTLCLPLRLPPTEFEKLDHLPDPVPDTEVTTSPSLMCSKLKPLKNIDLQSVQHVRNVEMMLMCNECEMWHLLYSKRKLKPRERTTILEGGGVCEKDVM